MTTPQPAIWVYTKPACVQGNGTYKGLEKEGLKYTKIDITVDDEARDFIMALGYLQAPVVYVQWTQPPHLHPTGDCQPEHWSGFRPDRIKLLTTKLRPETEEAAAKAV